MKKHKKCAKKGQLSIVNIFMWVILVAIGAVVTPILSEFAQVAANATNATTAILLANSIVPVFWLGVVITFFLYIAPIRVQQY
jgi:uncharacterized protein (UPF0333 family)